jgi:hypothetical protein
VASVGGGLKMNGKAGEFQPGDSQHWTFLIGTNWTDYRAWEKKGFYKIRLDKGKAIFDILDNTEEERRARGRK